MCGCFDQNSLGNKVTLYVCRFMETWMMCWSLICLVLTAFTCATFLVDADRFRSVSCGIIKYAGSSTLWAC